MTSDACIVLSSLLSAVYHHTTNREKNKRLSRLLKKSSKEFYVNRKKAVTPMERAARTGAERQEAGRAKSPAPVVHQYFSSIIFMISGFSDSMRQMFSASRGQSDLPSTLYRP